MKLPDTAAQIGARYRSDRVFRGKVGIYRGMTVNLVYSLFRGVMGVIYSSVWLLSTAAYYLVLGCIRLGLARAYRMKEARGGLDYERRCYGRTAWLLLLLDIPMGGMIILMIVTETGSAYPGYTIYASAAYTFYIMTMSVLDVIRFRKLGSPILSAAKVLNSVAAMMSILGLQNALISTFSPENKDYLRLMNSLTGTGIYLLVIAIAIYMVSRSRKGGAKREQVRE